MATYKLLVLSTPVEGREDEYNDWYQNVHLRDVVAVKGFKSAQRFRLTKALLEHETYPYLAIYEIDTDDIEAAQADLLSRSGTSSMVISEALGTQIYAATYEVMGPAVTS